MPLDSNFTKSDHSGCKSSNDLAFGAELEEMCS